MSRRITSTGIIHRRTTSGVDRYGNPQVKPVKEWKKENLPLFSIQPVSVQEKEVFASGRETIATMLRLSAPVDAPVPGVDDLISLPGVFAKDGMWEVVGEVEFWDKNPVLAKTLHAGMVIRVARHRR